MMIVVEGRVFRQDRLEQCCVGIEDGKIIALKKILKGDRHFDFRDKMILPGCIDAHVHFREPGKTYKEDFYSGTMAAAFGGVTCALDMPNNTPPINSKERFEEKLDMVKGKANIDFGLYAALNIQDEVAGLAKCATGFKVYMAQTTDSDGINTGYDEMGPLVSSASANKVVSIHCEDERLMNPIEEKNLEDHLRARPSSFEAEAIKQVLGLAKRTSGNIHIAHVTSAEGAGLIEGAKRDTPITSEVTLSHMLLNVNSDLKAFGKVNPPLRKKSDNEVLRRAFASGAIDIMASDHAPHTIEDKSGEFMEAPSGIPGVETSIPIMLRLLKKDFISLPRFVEATGTKPASLFGLNKGLIKTGYDADLIVVDMKDVGKIKADKLHSKSGWTPFEGHEAIFPEAVFLRGQLVVEDGNMAEERCGRFVDQPHMPV
jgi:dihydroorotase